MTTDIPQHNDPRFDLSYRPESYWDTPDTVTAIRANIKGQLRRERVTYFVTGQALPEEKFPKLKIVNELANEGGSRSNWYAGFVDDMRQVFGNDEDAEMFVRFFAATTPQAKFGTKVIAKDNIDKARIAFREWRAGQAFSEPFPLVNALLNQAVREGFDPANSFTAHKVRDFYLALNRDTRALADLMADDWEWGAGASPGNIHPRWMGGEYLPDCDAGEVEIARIVLDSTTMDVVSFRAHQADGQGTDVEYAAVDEYDSSWTLTRRSSVLPLTMGQLIGLIDQATCSSDDRDESLDFVANIWRFTDPIDSPGFVTVESDFYPQLSSWYSDKEERWIEEHRQDDDDCRGGDR